MTTSNQHDHCRRKIKDLKELSLLLDDVRAEGRKVVHCHGVFDLLHIGHIRHFDMAKQLGDVLVVTITADEFVNKGPGRPAFGEALRSEAIAALESVDFVATNRRSNATELIKLLRPDYYVKGSDYKNSDDDRTGGIILEEAAVQSVGGQLVFTDDITFSASQLINQHLPVFPKEVTDFLANLSSRFSSEDVLGYLEGALGLKVLVIGETIIDEYVYCETLGKSGKEPVLASRQVGTEKFAGGVIAIANHISAISDHVAMLTFLGPRDSQEDFIREKLAPEVNPTFLYSAADVPTIVKRRFIESYPFQKLFEVYVMEGGEYDPVEATELRAQLERIIGDYDVVMVADYGHGMLAPEVVELLCNNAHFLAVNTQSNAGNQGFNTISKYRRADFICLSELELRLEARSKQRDLRDIVEEVADNLSCPKMMITRGKYGCLTYSRDEGFSEIPALAQRVVDRIGAGDAGFSVAALCAVQDAPMDMIGFFGNVAGAEAVGTVGNRTSIERIPFYRHVETLLK